MSATREVDREIEDLLPFYVNNTLSAAERERVETALAGDAELRRRLDLVTEEVSAAISANEALGAPSPRVLDALMARIEAEPKTTAQVLGAARTGLIERFGALLAALSPRTLAYVTAAAVGVIALQSVMLSGAIPGTSRGTGYETASAPTAASGTHVLIAFAPEAKAAQIADLLARTGASIVEGPRASGLYRLRISEKALAKEEVARILGQLQAASGVVALVAPDR